MEGGTGVRGAPSLRMWIEKPVATDEASGFGRAHGGESGSGSGGGTSVWRCRVRSDIEFHNDTSRREGSGNRETAVTCGGSEVAGLRVRGACPSEKGVTRPSSESEPPYGQWH